LLSAASVAILGVSPTAVRVVPALEMGLIVVLIALIARDLGGSRRAQVLAAMTAALSGYLGAGHLDTTTDPDLLAWGVTGGSAIGATGEHYDGWPGDFQGGDDSPFAS
jgi:4-amino-4-deoxy-L-arabinose transferase-like glycosyltransferase